MKDPIYKHWQEWYEEEGFVTVDEQEKRLDVLATYNARFDQSLYFPIHVDSAANYILVPNFSVIKEYNATFIELMRNHSYKYNTKRIVPIQIIRSLIDVGVAFKAYIDSPNKVNYIAEYHKEAQCDKIDNQRKDQRYISYYVEQLDNDYPGIKALYKECCKYVHSSYYKAKANSLFHYSIKPGRIGFMGNYYKVKYEDFENEINDGVINYGNLPFDYEEEVDIINYCIEVNDMLLDLAETIKEIEIKKK